MVNRNESFSSVKEQLGLHVYNVELASYDSLDIVDLVKPHWIISHVLSGRVMTSVGGESYEAREGEVMIHPPHLPFSEHSHTNGVHQWMQVDIKISHNIDLFRYYPVSPVVKLSEPQVYSGLFDSLLQAWYSHSAVRELTVSALTMQLVSFVLESMNDVAGTSRYTRVHDRFAGVIVYMRNHIANKITRDDLASIVNLHPVYFDRIFHQEYGVSPMQFLKNIRLKQAQNLLETTDDTLETIADHCGLGDAPYFSRVFQQSVGVSPGQYRKSLKNTKTGYIPPL
jgi:AraC-like DNA-binding protein